MTPRRSVYRGISIIFALVFVFTGMGTGTAFAGDSLQEDPLPPDQTDPQDGTTLGFDPQTGQLIFVGTQAGAPLPAPVDVAGLSAEDVGRVFIDMFAGQIGLQDPVSELQIIRSNVRADGRTVVRYQQIYKSIPVFAAETILNIKGSGELMSLGAKVVADLAVNTTPTLNAAAAAELARQKVAENNRVAADLLMSSTPELWIYAENLLMQSQQPPFLVWRMEVSGLPSGPPADEVVLVDAEDGRIALNYPLMDREPSLEPSAGQKVTNPVVGPDPQGGEESGVSPNGGIHPSAAAAKISIYDMGYRCMEGDDDCINSRNPPVPTADPPGDFICDEDSQADCIWGDSGFAYAYLEDTFNLYIDWFDRNSYDDDGGRIKASIDYGDSYKNAFWSEGKKQMFFGTSYATADDVVGHELTHAVTSRESDLVYALQSGAINESLSDIFGEFIDLGNGQGWDSDEVKWLHAEDLPKFDPVNDLTGANRDMRDPTLNRKDTNGKYLVARPCTYWSTTEVCLAGGHTRQPDKMSSKYYYSGPNDEDHDWGGVHINSGINNKAAYLMADGDTFNGFSISGIGNEKTARVYYEAQTNLLASASNYLDLYFILYQACQNLVGTHGITDANCQVVRSATQAVELQGKTTSFCPSGKKFGHDIYNDSDPLENNVINWIPGMGSGSTNEWYRRDTFPSTGNWSLFGKITGSKNDSWVELDQNISIPKGPTAYPNGISSYLAFEHVYNFEKSGSTYRDGGVVEYAVSSTPAKWIDIEKIGFTFGGNLTYGGKIGSNSNPLGARKAFVGVTNNYRSTRFILSAQEGKQLRFRWRLGEDSNRGHAFEGWFVDRVRIYTCAGIPAKPTPSAPSPNDKLETDYTPRLDWTDAAPDVAYYILEYADNSNFTSSFKLIVDNRSEYTFPVELESGKTWYWRVEAFNELDEGSGVSATWKFRLKYKAPQLTTPGPSAYLETYRPTFNWNDVTNAAGYKLELYNGTKLWKTFTISTPTSQYTPGMDLPDYKDMYWRVQTTKACCGPSAWSEKRKFKSYTLPSIPKLKTPATNTFVGIGDFVDFDWEDATPYAYLDEYQFQIDDNENFSSPLVNVTKIGPDNSYKKQVNTSEFQPATTYYWRVRSLYKGESRDWKKPPHFTIKTRIKAPLYTSPAHSTQRSDPSNPDTLRPTFKWTAPAGGTAPSGYTLQIAKDFDFTNLVLTKKGITGTQFTPTADLPAYAALYWRVISEHPTYGLSSTTSYTAWRFFTPDTSPTLTAPADDQLIQGADVTLDWNAPPVRSGTSLASYSWEIYRDAAFTDFVMGGGGDASSTAAGVSLNAPATTLYWRVRATNNYGEDSAWSPGRKFRLAYGPPYPSFVSPKDDATNTLLTNQPSFMWEAMFMEAGSTLQVSRYANFSSLLINVTVPGGTMATGYSPTSDLPANVTIYWRVRTEDPKYPSAWAYGHSFKSANPPSIPVLLSPEDNFLTTDYTPTLSWKKVTLPAGTTFNHYEIAFSVSCGDGCTYDLDPAVISNVNTVAYTTVNDWDPARTHTWRMRAFNSLGQYSSWSAARRIRTVVAPPFGLFVFPLEGNTVNTNRPFFSWDSKNPYETSYTLQLSDNSSFSSFLINTTVTGSGSSTYYFPPTDLPPDIAAYWRMKSIDANYGTSDWVNGPSFTTANPPSIPVLVSPADGSTTTSVTPTLTWQPTILPPGTTFDYYEISMGKIVGGGTQGMPTIILDYLTTSFTFSAGDLEANSTYIWSMVAYNTLNQYSSSSPTWTFHTPAGP
jgi:bacillolysin